jgi:ring-1,2-phenylacetyl-CoA epoxidase subunit PaaE
MSLTPRFHRLMVREVRRETPEAVSLTFDIPELLAPDYAFAAGQYLTLRAPLEGEELRRSYSICSAPDDGELRIAVKRVDDGRFSGWVNDALHAGDAIDVMTPTGRFGVPAEPDSRRVHAFFAAGSGITPILSLLRDLLAREPHSRCFLFYGNRSTGQMLFRDALEQLKDRHLARFSVFHVLSQEQQDVDVLNGRLDRAKLALLLRHVLPAASIDDAFVCGPAGMSEDVQAVLQAAGVPEARIHVERFVSAQGGLPRPRPAPPPDAPPHAIAALVVDGRRFEVPVAAEEAVLDAALRAGLDLPYACKGGMCSTCRARVVEGAVKMLQNYSLEPWELAAGYVLTCQARPTTARVLIDYDQV